MGLQARYSSAFCLSSLSRGQQFLATHIAAKLITLKIARRSDSVEMRAMEVSMSWWEPDVLWVFDFTAMTTVSENPVLTLSPVTWCISTSALSSHPVPHPLCDFQSFSRDDWSALGLLPPSACALLILTWVLSNVSTPKFVGLSTTLGSPSIQFPSLLSVTSRVSRPLCCLSLSFCLSWTQISPGPPHPTPRSRRLAAPCLPPHTRSHTF